MGLAQAIRDTLAEMEIDDPFIQELHIKMSGCPNSCGQHHMANIGFHGGTLKSEGKQLPAYEIFLGGQYENTGGNIRIGDRISIRLPAKRVPEGLKRILAFYKRARQAGENFNNFYGRVGKTPIEEVLRDLHIAGQFNDDDDLFVDWSESQPYVLERGEGECMS